VSGDGWEEGGKGGGGGGVGDGGGVGRMVGGWGMGTWWREVLGG